MIGWPARLSSLFDSAALGLVLFRLLRVFPHGLMRVFAPFFAIISFFLCAFVGAD